MVPYLFASSLSLSAAQGGHLAVVLALVDCEHFTSVNVVVVVVVVVVATVVVVVVVAVVVQNSTIQSYQLGSL